MDNEPVLMDETLESWVIGKTDNWRNHYEGNFAQKFDEYYRLWRGIWAEQDKTRQSERSRIISPAIMQAVESSVAEIEEATFGRGRWFDVTDNMGDKEREDVQFLRNKLHEDFQNRGIRKSVAECLINAAVFGTGIAEVITDEIKEQKPATQPILDGQMQAYGVEISDRTIVDLRPIMPKQFLIDPVATCIKDALGCAVDEFVPYHSVKQLQESGVYRDESLEGTSPDQDIEPDDDLIVYNEDKIRLTKYYGLVPRDLLEKAMREDDEDVVDLMDEGEDNTSYYVEAIVVIGNAEVLLKAEENPFMMQERPIIAFPWDVVPGRFHGRGVVEKGYNSQKALDAEIRGRIDALALTIHPMMAIDATRIPRGHKPEIRPGKMLLTNGDPKDILHPFNFGNVSQITFAQAGELTKMVQTATGAVDSAGIAGSINGEATAAGISMSLGAIIKRHKRTLINFQEAFLIPFVQKAAWRYMQFDPENYPVKDYKFNVTSSLGIIAREYEVGQLTQVLQTMSPDGPLYATMLQAIIEHMNLSNREDFLKQLEKAAQPTPEQQQAAQAQEQRAQEAHQAQVGVFTSQANESNSRARKYDAEAKETPELTNIKRIAAATGNLREGDADDKDFQRRLDIVDRMLKEQEMIDRREERRTQKANPMEDALMRRLAGES